jgi:peptidoglycan lytic transglycosylase B
MKSMIYILFAVAMLSSSFLEKNKSSENKAEFFAPLIKTLRAEGVDSLFIDKLIMNEGVKFNEKYVKINVTGYHKKADYSSHYNSRAVRKSKEFYSEYSSLLANAEKIYGVPKEVITSILWVETRHGSYLGSHHLPSVFVSTAMASEGEFIDLNSEMLRETYAENSDSLAKYMNKLQARSKKKSKWAVTEIKALSELDQKGIDIFALEGSWAGAFGMSQFLPSSYLQWAVDGDGDGKINLFEHQDAIHSVANYLKTNGWGESDKKQRKAVYHYNHSTAYVDAVLKLAELIKV